MGCHRGAQPVGDREAVCVTHAPLWGLARVAALELPNLRCSRVDLDPSAAAEEQAANLASEIFSDTKEDQIAYCGNARYVAA